MAKQTHDPETRVDRWLRLLKDNPISAFVIVVSICIGAAGSFYKSLPADWQCLSCWLAPVDPSRDLPNNGWVHAGYLDRANTANWSQPAKVRVVKRSEAQDRPYPIRDGDIVQPVMPLPQVIIGYANSKSENVLRAPPEMVNVIDPKRDYTGRTLDPKVRYLVNDMSVAAFPSHDYVVWLRLTPWTAPD